MDQPRWLASAWSELGQREVGGRADNPRVAALFRDVGQNAHDEVPWCAAFVGACLERAGIKSTRSLLARSYLGWGAPLEEGRVGAIAVLSRGSDPAAGHVGFLLGETAGNVYLLGGNQSDAVTVAAFPRGRLLGLRWPQEAAEPVPQPEEARIDAALFDEALAHVLEMEGGYSDDPHDPGGPTNRGITLRVFAAWKRVPADAALKEELKRIPDETVRDIYAARYWAPACCGELAPALAFFHFDTAVNHGVSGAIRLLQQAVGTDVDGEIGPLTLGAIGRLPLSDGLEAYADVRRQRYRALPHFWRFGRGWLARVDATLARAREIAERGAALTSSVPPSPVSPSPEKGPSDMATTSTPTKWWGSSMTIWGALITGLSTVLPALGPVIGVDITGELVREAGEGIVQTVQAVGGLLGTIMTIYGRMRASGPLERRDMTLKL
jgi:uncharacterized protein (TIGR02594 family)